MNSYNTSIRHPSRQRDASSSEPRSMAGEMTVTRRFKILAGYTIAYLLVAGSMALADAILTGYVLEHSSDAYELNVKVDASSPSAILGGASRSLAIFTGLFFVSLAMCLADDKQRKYLQINSRWDESFVRLPGAAAIWNLILLFGALINNGGMILFEFSWLHSTLGLIGFKTDNEQMAAFVLFPLVTLVILLVPTYLIFSKLVDTAKRLMPEVETKV